MPGPPLGIFGEVVLAEFLLFLETKRAVVGGDKLAECPWRGPARVFSWCHFFAERWSEKRTSRLQIRARPYFPAREYKYCGQGLRVGGPGRGRRASRDFFKRLVAGEVDDIKQALRAISARGDGAGKWLSSASAVVGGALKGVIFRGAFFLSASRLPGRSRSMAPAVFSRVHADQGRCVSLPAAWP